MANDNHATRNTYAGLFLVTLAILMHEILLTRIFSVTMYYHFAFMAISIAMFGMTVGAVLVYLLPGYFSQERAKSQLGLSAFLFAVVLALSFLTQLVLPSVLHLSLPGLYSIILKYFVVAVPFIFAGICVSLALTRFPAQISQLYAADLAGAALGCVAVVFVLKITDGPTTVIVAALLASVGASFFARDLGDRRLRRAAMATTVLFTFLAAGNTVLAHRQRPFLRMMWVKGRIDRRPLYEKWNSFSRVTVGGDPDRSHEPYQKPFGWGLSPTYPPERTVDQYLMLIDGAAATPLTAFDGDTATVEHLKYDVTNIVHYVRPDSDVLVIGAGGGRDVLSALAFDQKSVLAVELNDNIIDTVNDRFGDFTGHLDQDPRVTFVGDEARSYIARLDDQYDIVQLSLIDTWAATAAGALALSENQLYTLEAWRIFLDHLTPRGLLSVSRWYFLDRPGEVYRMTTLASVSLNQLGIQNPRDHIVIVRYMFRGKQWWEKRKLPEGVGVGTILVSKEPFSNDDLDEIQRVADQMEFEVVLSPRFSLDSTFESIASGHDLDEFLAEYPLDISAPTDDSPYFFQMLRFRDIFSPKLWRQGLNTPNVIAVLTVGVLFICVTTLTFLCILVPLILTSRKESLRGAAPLFVFFAAIGLGFMLVEISQMQRMIIFLGHPTYGLSVVLFTLLLSSGLGSFCTRSIGRRSLTGSAVVRLLFALASLGLFAALAPPVMRMYQGSETMVRIVVAVLTLFPVGFFLGMPFPIGMKLAANRSAALTPWLWGINGATSVCASVIGVAIALSSGIFASYVTGASCYVLALGAYLWARRAPGDNVGPRAAAS